VDVVAADDEGVSCILPVVTPALWVLIRCGGDCGWEMGTNNFEGSCGQPGRQHQRVNVGCSTTTSPRCTRCGVFKLYFQRDSAIYNKKCVTACS